MFSRDIRHDVFGQVVKRCMFSHYVAYSELAFVYHLVEFVGVLNFITL